MKTKFTLIIGLFLLLQSCSFDDTPKKYFDVTTLNTNTLQTIGESDLQQMKVTKEHNQLYSDFVDGKMVPTTSCVEYIKYQSVMRLDYTIASIKKLKPTSDTEEMINRSLDLFNFAKEIYATDYIEIAKLLDKNPDDEVFNNAIYKFEEKIAPTMDTLYQKLLDVALPYAKKHNITVTLE